MIASDPHQPRLQLPAIQLLEVGAIDLHWWAFPNTVDSFWRLYWVDRGGAFIQTDRRYDLAQDHLVAIPPDTSASLWQDRPVFQYFMHFTAQLPFSRADPRIYRTPIPPAMREVASRTARQVQARPGPVTPSVSAGTLLLISWALAHVPTGCWRQASGDGRIHETLAYIEQSLAEPLGNEQLARRIGLSAGTFARLFRRQLGMSPHQYILKRRIDLAARHLLSTDYPIDVIARTCGFCDRYYFTRMFTQLRGIAPGAFRRKVHLEGPAR